MAEEIDRVEIEPLSDEELEGVAGGVEREPVMDSSSGPVCCSCENCS